MSYVHSVDEGRSVEAFRDTTLMSPELQKHKKHTPCAVETTVVLGDDKEPVKETELHEALKAPLESSIREAFETAPPAGAPTRKASDRPLVRRLQTPGGNSSVFFGEESYFEQGSSDPAAKKDTDQPAAGGRPNAAKAEFTPQIKRTQNVGGDGHIVFDEADGSEYQSLSRIEYEKTWKPEASKELDQTPIAGTRVTTERPHIHVLQPTGGRVSINFGTEREYNPSQRTYVTVYDVEKEKDPSPPAGARPQTASSLRVTQPTGGQQSYVVYGSNAEKQEDSPASPPPHRAPRSAPGGNSSISFESGYGASFETEAQAASRSALGKAIEGVPPHKPIIQRLQPAGGRQSIHVLGSDRDEEKSEVDAAAEGMSKLNIESGGTLAGAPVSSRSVPFGETGYRSGKKRFGSPTKSQVFFGQMESIA